MHLPQSCLRRLKVKQAVQQHKSNNLSAGQLGCRWEMFQMPFHTWGTWEPGYHASGVQQNSTSTLRKVT